MPTLSPIERFFKRVQKPDDPIGCWLWTGARTRFGYGRFWMNGKNVPAHRFSYEIAFGVIAPDMMVCHSCDTPSCVNPTHLWLGTNADNLGDMARKGRAATAERNGTYTHPESRAIGNRNGKYTHPESTPRGEKHGMHTHPETRAHGEKCWNSKLKNDDVRNIRRRFAEGTSSKLELSAEFHVHSKTISRIIQRKLWKHIE